MLGFRNFGTQKSGGLSKNQIAILKIPILPSTELGARQDLSVE